MWPWKRAQIPNRDDILYAHKLAEEIRNKLTAAIVVGVGALLTTGVTAIGTYYTRDLPEAIRTLTASVQKLNQHAEYQTQKNAELTEAQKDIRDRLNRLEDKE